MGITDKKIDFLLCKLKEIFTSTIRSWLIHSDNEKTDLKSQRPLPAITLKFWTGGLRKFARSTSTGSRTIPCTWAGIHPKTARPFYTEVNRPPETGERVSKLVNWWAVKKKKILLSHISRTLDSIKCSRLSSTTLSPVWVNIVERKILVRRCKAGWKKKSEGGKKNLKSLKGDSQTSWKTPEPGLINWQLLASLVPALLSVLPLLIQFGSVSAEQWTLRTASSTY